MIKTISALLIILALYVSATLLLEKSTNKVKDQKASDVFLEILPQDQEHTHEDQDEGAHEEDFHYHAGFRVVVDGELQNYDDGDFMHFSPCGIAPSKDLTDPFEKIHLHNYIGDVAHIHANPVTWREFFQGLKMDDLLEREDVSVYISGEKTEEGLGTLVNEYDSVLMVFGDEKLIDLEDQNYWTTKERVIEGESGVEYCGDDEY